MRQITIPSERLRATLRMLSRGIDQAWFAQSVGARWEGGEIAEVCQASVEAPGGRGTLGIRLADRLAHSPDGDVPDDSLALLELGRGDTEGLARGWFRGEEGVWLPADRLFLPGPRLTMVPLRALPEGASDPAFLERHSRTIGALGADGYGRIAGLRIGLVGLGRLGSILARSLVDFGVRRLSLIDPDVVEPHNLGEGGFYDEATIGIPKAEAWENWLALHFPEVEVDAVARSITHRAALDALARCEVLVSAPDHSLPRMVAGLVAAAWHRPLLDVGTQVHRPGGSTTMGADARLILTGAAPGCLLCAGGVADEPAARAALHSPDAEHRLMAGRVWQEERPGSLHSLNLFAASLGLRMLEDCAAGRIAGTAWRRGEFGADGQVSVRNLAPAQPSTECFCELAGWGGAAFARLGPLLTRRAARAAVGLPG